MDNTQMVQILPLSCGIYSDGIFITAEDSDAVVKIMREHNELSRKGSGISLLILLGIWMVSLYMIYKFFKMMLEIEKIGKEDMKDDEQ